jgi:IS30 family transposase
MVVLTLLEWKWSPQQIAATFKRTFPDESERNVSHETIYTAIYAQPRGELRRQLIACLRFGRSTRLPRSRGTDRRGQIPDMVSIHVRPPEVDDRVMPGHWEGDFIKGAGNKSSVGVLVERSSRLVLLVKMADASAASALAGFSAKLNSIAAPMRHTLTYDQGKELVRHADLSVYSQDELDTIADSLNTRPRATHSFNTPLAVFSHILGVWAAEGGKSLISNE